MPKPGVPGGGPPTDVLIEPAAPETESAFTTRALGAKPVSKFSIWPFKSGAKPGIRNPISSKHSQPLIQQGAVTDRAQGAADPYAGHMLQPQRSRSAEHVGERNESALEHAKSTPWRATPNGSPPPSKVPDPMLAPRQRYHIGSRGRGAAPSAEGSVGRGAGGGAPTQSPPIWGSFERSDGQWVPYSAVDNAAIESAFARGEPFMDLPRCSNATIHFNRSGGHHHQTTPATGSKPSGFRSVLRGMAGMKATLHWDGSMWRLEYPDRHTGYEQQVEIYAEESFMMTPQQVLNLCKSLDEAKKREEMLQRQVGAAKEGAIQEFQSKQAAQALRAAEDERHNGRVVAMAPVSQYTAAEGKSACTTIACFGALELLQRHRTFGAGLVEQPVGFALSPPHLHSPALADALVRVVTRGVDAHVRALSLNQPSQHRSAAEVMDALPATHELREKLFRGTCCEKLLSSSEDEQVACFKELLKPPAAPLTAAGYVLTKPPETVLCVIGADISAPCFLLDSHPNPSRRLDGAHLLRFDCVQSLCTALCRRFPVMLTDVNPEEWQLTYVRQISAMQLMLTVPLTGNERIALQCPIELDLMVDPVVAMDGNTYERSQILQHFEYDRARIASTQQPAHDDDACCGHARARYTINSPLDGGQPILNELLVKNTFALKAIQDAVEGGRVGDGEMCEWRRRREEVRREEVVRQGGQGGLGGAVLEPSQWPAPPERPRSHLKEGFLIVGNGRMDAPRRYVVLFMDRLSWYRDDSKNEPLGQFRFRAHTEVELDNRAVQLILKTTSSDQWAWSQGDAPPLPDKVVIRANAHNTSVELQEWQDAIREQLRKYAAMSYAPRAEDARILENGLAIGLCTEPELKVGRDTAIRGLCECCGQTAPPTFAPRQCKRCARVLCVACVPHSAFSFEAVIDIESVSEPQCNHPICVECFEDIVDRLRRTVVDETERRHLQRLNEKLHP